MVRELGAVARREVGFLALAAADVDVDLVAQLGRQAEEGASDFGVGVLRVGVFGAGVFGAGVFETALCGRLALLACR